MSKQAHKHHIVVVDDKMAMAETIAESLEDAGFSAMATSSGKQALAYIEKNVVDALITDLRMPDMDGIELLSAARRLESDLPVILMTAYGAVESAIQAIRCGAYHYVTKPFKVEELIIYLERALNEASIHREARALRRTLDHRIGGSEIIARSANMRAVLDILDRIATSDVPVLLSGPTGTGKGLIARHLHQASSRARGPFVTINCAAMPEMLLESELFGHIKGAFTGASTNHAGLFTEASGGTLFLDEIGEMALLLQAKLLDVLERRVVRPVGSARELPVDVRIVSATHCDLRRRVTEGKFREDLLYRLDVVPIAVAPLRERREDIPALVERFLLEARTRHPSSHVVSVSPECLQELMEYPWPGNVRELRHAIERLVLLGRNPEAQFADAALPRIESTSTGEVRFAGPVKPLRSIQHEYAKWALRACGGNKARTADRMEIDVKTLAKYLAGDSSD